MLSSESTLMNSLWAIHGSFVIFVQLFLRKVYLLTFIGSWCTVLKICKETYGIIYRQHLYSIVHVLYFFHLVSLVMWKQTSIFLHPISNFKTKLIMNFTRS